MQAKDINSRLRWRENMLGYLTSDIVPFEFGQRTVFRQRLSKKIVSFEEQIISLAYIFSTAIIIILIFVIITISISISIVVGVIFIVTHC